MLAQNFLSADTLGLTADQHSALIKALAHLESARAFGKFDMNHWCDGKQECGTTMCIGGTAEWLHTGKTPGNLFPLSEWRLDYSSNPPLSALFAPTVGIRCTDPRRGARALRNYLQTGDSSWPAVMAIAEEDL